MSWKAIRSTAAGILMAVGLLVFLGLFAFLFDSLERGGNNNETHADRVERANKEISDALAHVSEIEVEVIVVPDGLESLAADLRSAVESRLHERGLKINPKAEWKFQVGVRGFLDKNPWVDIAFRHMGKSFFGREDGEALLRNEMRYRGRSDLLGGAVKFAAETTDGFLDMWMKAKLDMWMKAKPEFLK